MNHMREREGGRRAEREPRLVMEEGTKDGGSKRERNKCVPSQNQKYLSYSLEFVQKP